MKKLTYSAIFLTTLFMSCGGGGEQKETQQPEEKAETTQEVEELPSLIGEWRNVTMKVVIKSEPDSILEVQEGQWEEVMKIQPIRTTFKEDGTYVSEYRTLEDQIMMTSNGVWSVNGDELTMQERGEDVKYQFEINDDIVTFTGYLDWDSDGEADDHYSGTQKRYIPLN